MHFRGATVFFLGMSLGCVSGWEATGQGPMALWFCVLFNIAVAGLCYDIANRRGEPTWRQ